jgi:acid stress-induced BolA-like protein IbaG/YrbA
MPKPSEIGNSTAMIIARGRSSGWTMRGVMSNVKLQQILSERLSLVHPIFRLEKIGTKLAGSVISETFKGKSERQRLHMLWDALDAELGADAVRQVGTLLLYTPEEWNIDLPNAPKAKSL